ncbi:MAG: asparagine synthase (glutamine-hydrolyzing) [Bryobacteraceae bacterium]|jgi:asparagine synthase (glutamine-hydrolysing)
MCAITGFVTTSQLPAAETVLRSMTDRLRYRGPDGNGYFCDTNVYLGHRRLSIIDVTAGAQPMCNEDGRVWIVYNGEIFNHADLRPALEQAGHTYKTHCDTETILHAYEQYGEACLSGFRGMFAFAIWDSPNDTLLCARDRLGIKPFYYYWDGSTFVFASEIKSLLAHPAVGARLEESVVPEYLAFGYLSGDRTLFSDIRKLLPGHKLRLRLNGGTPSLDVERFWDVPESRNEKRSDTEWIAECRSRLEETVRMRLMSDVPLGMFLSGGVDSSVIAALMKRMTSTPVRTFAVGYAETQFSELAYARQVATHLGTDHHEVVVGMEEFFNALPELVWHEDEPIAWPSSVSLYFVARLAAEHVKVVLTGEGSDELFGGYGRYRFYEVNQRYARLYRILPAALRGAIRGLVANSGLFSGSFRRKLQHTFVGRGDDLESLYLDNFYSAFSASEQKRTFPALPREDVYAGYMRYRDAASGRSELERLLYADQKTYLVELLMKQDQMSMACSIESRVPFLDHPLVEFAAQVPGHLKIRNGEGKYILKRAVEDLLPRKIIYRKKMGFPTPLRQWLRNPQSLPIDSFLTSTDGLVASFTDLPALKSLLDRHRSGAEDATDRIWRLLNLQLWGDIFLLGKRENRREGMFPAAAAPSLR